jgi:hypothetical protein
VTDIHRKEPAWLIAALTGGAGFLVQTGLFNADTMQALGTAAGIAGLQGILTRQRVYSPHSADEKRGQHVGGDAPAPPLASTWGLNQTEPALLSALVALLGGFVTQVGAGLDPLHALSAAAGLSGTQGVVTRQAVHAPGRLARERWRRTADDLQQRLRPSIVTEGHPEAV